VETAPWGEHTTGPVHCGQLKAKKRKREGRLLLQRDRMKGSVRGRENIFSPSNLFRANPEERVGNIKLHRESQGQNSRREGIVLTNKRKKLNRSKKREQNLVFRQKRVGASGDPEEPGNRGEGGGANESRGRSEGRKRGDRLKTKASST